MSEHYQAVAVPESLTGDQLIEALDNAPENTTVIHLSPQMRRLLAQYAPTKSTKAEEGFSDQANKDRDYFDPKIRDASAPELMHAEQYLKRMAFQFQSELVRGVSTVPVCISDDRGDEDTYASKLHSLSRLKSMARVLTGDFTMSQGKVRLAHDSFDFELTSRKPEPPTIDSLITAMVDFTKLFRNMPEWLESSNSFTIYAKDVPLPEFGYVEHIVDKIDSSLGKGTVTGMVLYGSRATIPGGLQAKSEDIERCSDYDHNLLVEAGTMRAVLDILRGGNFHNEENGKHLGFNVIEEPDFTSYVRMNHDPFESSSTNRVLYGEAVFPNTPMGEVPERGLSHAVLRGFAMQSLACWNFANPEFLLERQPLMDYVNKTPLFGAQAALNCLEGPALRNKDDYVDFLSQFGGVQTVDSSYTPRENAEIVCHNAALLVRVLESVGEKKFENVKMDMTKSPHRIYLDPTELVTPEKVIDNHYIYTA
tara:strand:- start:9466 stop:10902 length:1437 start_codon:yes stop_codon:yes gene_type:complete